jgi:hypothetical protein
VNSVLADFVGRELTRAAYISLPDTWFDLLGDLHIVDYGLELEFGDRMLRVDAWLVGRYELVLERDPEIELVSNGEVTDVSTMEPWRRLIGSRLQDASFGAGAFPCEQDRPWLLTLHLGEAMVWIASATIIPETVTGRGTLGRLLLPCSDEMVIAWEQSVALELGMASKLK